MWLSTLAKYFAWRGECYPQQWDFDAKGRGSASIALWFCVLICKLRVGCTVGINVLTVFFLFVFTVKCSLYSCKIIAYNIKHKTISRLGNVRKRFFTLLVVLKSDLQSGPTKSEVGRICKHITEYLCCLVFSQAPLWSKPAISFQEET